MTGKAPPSRSRKDKPRTSRPYDRPNQSIFGKVASTVKGLFTPSWLFNVSSWVRTNVVEEEEINANPDDTVEADLTENEDEPEVQPIRPRLLGRHKRPRLECSDNATSTPERPFWLGPSTSHDKLSSKCENPPVSPIISDCESIRKETPIIVNGDDHSENSDGSASTSGCSSLVSSQDKTHRSSGLKLSDSALELLRGELKNKPAFQRQRKEASTLTTDMLNSPHNISQGNVSLWSCRTQSPAKTPQIPSLLNSSRPSFNVSSFGGPAKGNSSSSKISSPFYEGSTTFGGASAYRRKPISNTPYQINRTKNLQCQVKVKENTSGKEFECMSSAAKRILHTLETMSTPVTDAKKIPSVCKSPLDIPLAITPPSQRLRSYLSISRPSSTVTPKGPPIVNLNAISKLTVLKNSHSKRNSMMELPLKEQPIMSLPDECSVSTPQYSSDAVSFSKASSGGGKMKTKLHEPLHTSSKGKVEQETMPEYELPSVPLPISSNMPVFKFNTKTIPDKTNVTLQNEKAKEIEDDAHNESTSGIQETPFTFASPIEYLPPKNSIQLQKSPVVQPENAFKFSSPLVVAQKSQSDEKEIYSNRSVDDILKSLREKSSSQLSEERPNKELQVKNHSSAAEKKQENSTSFSGFGDKFKPKQDCWTCASCWVQNDQSKQKCVACETPKENITSTASRATPSSSSTFGFGDKFKPKAGTWECSSCMVRNDASNKKCVACETPNPSKDTAASDETDKCEKDKGLTSGKLPANATSNKLFQNTTGTWECDTCMVRNSVDKNKCVACETLRPSKEKAAGSLNSSFKFGASVPNASQATTFKFGTFVSTSVPTTTTSSFKFGVPADAAKTTPVSCSFNFGSSAKTTATSTPVVTFGDSTISTKQPSDSTQDSKAVKIVETPVSEGIQFGTPTTSSTVSEPKHPISTLSSGPRGFQFSAPTTLAVSTSDSGGFQFSKPFTASAVSTSDSGGFQFGKPVIAVSTESGGFKFQSNTFGSTSFGSTIKHTTSEIIEKTPKNPPISSTSLPSFSIGTVTTSQSDASHSKVTPKSENLATTGTSLSQPGVSIFASTAPVFSFGVATCTPVAATTTTTSTSIDSGLFGNVSAQAKLKKIDEQPKSSVALDSSQTAATSVATSAVTAQFSFNPTNVFPTIPTTSTATVNFPTATSTTAAVGFVETKPVSSLHNQLPRTQTAAPAFSFGIASTTPSVFSFGSSSSTAQTTSSSGFITSTVVAKPAGLPTSSASDALESAQKGTGLFSFVASSKPEGKPNQTGFAFKSEKEGKVNFAPPSQTGFGAFQADPSSNSAMSSVPSSSLFKFGATTSASTGGFVFGATTKTDTAAPSHAAQFTFGSGTAKPTGFGVFQQNQQQQPTTSSMPTFSFGAGTGSLGGIDAGGAKAFTCFTTKNSQPQPPAAAISPAFGTQPAQPVFGGNAPTFGNTATAPALLSSAATPAFGNVPPPKPESSGGFNFNPQMSTGVFTFGASADKKPAVASPAQGTGFNFNMTSHVDSNTNFTPSFGINSPPSFNFGATPTNQPFQFAANSEVTSTSSPRRIRKAIRRVRKAD